jgi:phage-related protein
MADANVRVLVSALTEAAEESLEDVGNEMAGLSADGHVAAEGLDALSDEMSESTRSAIILQSALDEIGDEAVGAGIKAQFLQDALDEVGDQATQAAIQSQATSGAFTSLSISSQGASLSVGTLSSAFTLALIPAVLTAATVLAPLIVILGAVAAGAAALAGAFGLIIGTGILAFGEEKAQQNREELAQTERLIDQYESMKAEQGELTAQQQDRLRQLRQKKKALEDETTATGALGGVVADLKEELKPLLVEFGQEFIPLIREAVDAIPDVVESMLDAVGGTEEFEEALRQFGSLAAEVLPMLVGAMFDLARAALPVLRDLVSFIQGNGNAAMQEMRASVQELWPELMNLLDALIDLAPTLLEFGTNVGEVLIPALTWLVGVLDGMMEFVNGLDAGIRKWVIGLLLAAPILVKIAGIASSLATLLGFNGLLGLFISMGQFLVGLLPSLSGIVSAFSSLGSIASTVGSIIAGSTAALVAIGAAIGALGVWILDAVGAFEMIGDAGQWVGEILGKDLVDAIFVLLSILSLGLFPLIASLGAAIVELVRGDISGAVDAFMQVWGIFGEAFGNIGNMVVQGLMSLGQWFINIFSGIGSFVLGFIQDLADGFVGFFLDTLPNLVLEGMIFLVSAVEVQLNTLFNLFASVFNGIISLISTAIDTVINGVIGIVNNFLRGIDEVANAVSSVIGRDIGDIETLDQIDTSQIANDLQLEQRETGFSQVRQQNRQQVAGIRRQINQTEVNVDVAGDLQQDPYSFSRSVADQVTREQRQNNGT